MTASDIVLIQTCSMCPEQYDAKDEHGKQLGYLRLRWGEFTVNCPDCRGELVYSAEPKGDGMFDDDEREMYLQIAKDAIAEYWTNKTS